MKLYPFRYTLSLFLLFISFKVYPQYANNENISAVITANVGKYLAVDTPSLTVYSTPQGASSTLIPSGFSPMTWSWFAETSTIKIDCSDVAPIPNAASSTEPISTVPMCSPSLCQLPAVYSHNPKDLFATCKTTIQVLKEDPAKKAVYHSQELEAIRLKAQYSESKTYNEISEYCKYWETSTCNSLSPSKKASVREMIKLNLGNIKESILRKLGL